LDAELVGNFEILLVRFLKLLSCSKHCELSLMSLRQSKVLHVKTDNVYWHRQHSECRRA